MLSWNEMSPVEQAQCQYWDMYKDAYGVRPRGIDTTEWSLEQFEQEFEQLATTIQRNYADEQVAQEAAAHDFEMRMQSLMMSGAKSYEMALRWVHEAEGSDGDDEYLCFLVGLPYGYFRK
jgi:hypothetical protein